MSSHLKQAFKFENLQRSWTWVNTSTDVQYKNHFRNLYQAYAVSDIENLKDLRDQLRQRTFTAEHSTKLYLPKPSGILRPYSLLRINDQIVYFALISFVAQKFLPRAQHNYCRKVFGHLFAGINSQFFYRNWRDGYGEFNRQMQRAYSNGYKWVASFDLTAFYDSIDHKVLSHFLRNIGIEEEFIQFLINCLETWTVSGVNRIYQGHGIPQGPPPSGLLSEVILHYFDSNKNISKLDVRYFRYVDDIRLMGRDEQELRRALVELDYTSKETGLFPQSSKINIHPISNIAEEIKSISLPPEPFNRKIVNDQAKVLKRLNELSRGLLLQNETRFKYVLKHANSNATLAKRLMILLQKYPHLYINVTRYLEKFRVFSRGLSNSVIDVLKSEQMYEEVVAHLIDVSRSRIHDDCRDDLKDVCKDLHKRRKQIGSPNLRAAVFVFLLQHNYFSFSQIEKISTVNEWWLIQKSLDGIDPVQYGEESYEKLINVLIKSESFEVSIRSAFLMVQNNLEITVPRSEINPAAQSILKSAKILSRRTDANSKIAAWINNLTGMSLPRSKWKKLLGPEHANLEGICLLLNTYFKTDASAFVNTLDVFNDRVLDALFRHDASLGKYQIGNIGGVLNAPTGKFATHFPSYYALCKRVHELRLESDLSHPIVKSTGKPTRRIQFKEIKALRRSINNGLNEVWNAC